MYLVAALLVLFTGIFNIKLIKYPATVGSEIRHPIPGNFYALQPNSAVLLAILPRKEYPSPVDIGLLVYGGALILALSIYLPYHFFSDMNVQFADLHGGWFITPVATILVTNAILLYPVSETSLIVSLLYFGIGTMLFLLVLSVLFFRLLSHNLPTSELAPTNFIMLAPIGILIVPFLIFAYKISPKISAGTTAFTAIFSSLFGVLGHSAFGHLDFLLITGTAISVAIGATLGARLMKDQGRMDQGWLWLHNVGLCTSAYHQTGSLLASTVLMKVSNWPS
jgi:tellurite resistance protein